MAAVLQGRTRHRLRHALVALLICTFVGLAPPSSATSPAQTSVQAAKELAPATKRKKRKRRAKLRKRRARKKHKRKRRKAGAAKAKSQRAPHTEPATPATLGAPPPPKAAQVSDEDRKALEIWRRAVLPGGLSKATPAPATTPSTASHAPSLASAEIRASGSQGSGGELQGVRSQAPATAGLTRGLEMQAGPALLYWSHSMRSAAGSGAVRWHPLDPFYGAAASMRTWPSRWLGAELNFSGGIRAFGATIPDVMRAVDLTSYSFAAALRGRYQLSSGISVGARLGYSFRSAEVSTKISTALYPSYALHMVSPGVELRVDSFAPLLSVQLGAELSPAGVAISSLDGMAGDALSHAWGWTASGQFRSQLPWQLYAELRLFYSMSYTSYLSSALAPLSNAQYGKVELSSGQHGAALGIGWRY